jgi:hypothetical protein
MFQGLLANVSGVALQGCWGCSVTLARDVLGFVNSKKYTDGTGNASRTLGKQRKKSIVKTQRNILTHLFSLILSLPCL